MGERAHVMRASEWVGHMDGTTLGWVRQGNDDLAMLTTTDEASGVVRTSGAPALRAGVHWVSTPLVRSFYTLGTVFVTT